MGFIEGCTQNDGVTQLDQKKKVMSFRKKIKLDKESNLSPLCGGNDTFEHMLQCEHLNGIKWMSQQLISGFGNTARKQDTNKSLSDTFNSALTC